MRKINHGSSDCSVSKDFKEPLIWSCDALLKSAINLLQTVIGCCRLYFSPRFILIIAVAILCMQDNSNKIGFKVYGLNLMTGVASMEAKRNRVGSILYIQDHPSPTVGTKPADGRPLPAQERIGPDNQPSLEQG